MEIFIITLLAILSFYAGKYYQIMEMPDISVKYALNLLNENLVKLIVFYQSHYDAGDQLVLVKKWMDQIDKEKLHPDQKKIFKKFVKNW